MPEYLSPGVYVEEVDAGPKPIVGVSTSTAGMVGVTSRGPTSGKPRLVTSFPDFVRTFGGFLPQPDTALLNQWGRADNAEGGRWWLFPLAVRGFFDNGGQRLYVKRVFAETAVASSGVLGRGLISEVTRDAAADAAVTSPQIEVRHLFGIDNGSDVKIFRGDTGAHVGDFTVDAYDPTRRTITLDHALPQALRAGRDFVEIAQRSATPVPAPEETLRFRAKALGTWGDALQVLVRPMVGAIMNLLPDAAEGPLAVSELTADAAADTPQIEARAVAGTLDGATATPFSVQIVQRPFRVINVAAVGADRVRLTLGPRHGPWAVGLQLSAPDPGGGPPVVTQVAADAAADAEAVDVDEVAGSLDATTPTPFRVVVNRRPFVVTAVAAAAAGQVRLTLAPPHAAWQTGLAVRKLRRVNPGGATDTLPVAGAARLYPGAVVELDNGGQKEVGVVQEVAGDLVTLGAQLANAYLEEHKLRVVEAEVLVRSVDETGAVTEERFDGLRLAGDHPSNLFTRINRQSELVEVEQRPGFSATDPTQFPTEPKGGMLQLGGGDDRYNELTVDDFVGTDGGSGQRTGIEAFADIDEISICTASGMWSSTVQAALIGHCELLADRFAVLDPPDPQSIEQIRAFREPLDTKYAALYYPWLVTRDPSIDQDVRVPPSGHMLGVYARVDVERGVHKAPANVVIRGIRLRDGIAQDVTKREQDMLNPKGINALRFFPGMGHRVWGARTLSSDPSWKYVNVRRLFLYLEESIDEGTQWVVFEPNDERLWARVRQTVVNFLTTEWQQGKLRGLTADEAFFVTCDRTTMTPLQIENGMLICLIGVAPVFPAEFVIFRIQQKTLEAQPA